MNPTIFLVILLILGLGLSAGTPIRSPEETEIWTLEYPFNLITTGRLTGTPEKPSWEMSVKGVEEFWKAARSFSKKRRTRRGWSIGGRSSVPSDFSLLGAIEKHWERSEIGDSNNIFIIPPKDIQQVEELEAKYPNLVPLAYDELKQYSYPLLYFSRDTQTDKVRGLIIIDELDNSLAKLLAEKGVSLETPLWYENGQLEKIEQIEAIAGK